MKHKKILTTSAFNLARTIGVVFCVGFPMLSQASLLGQQVTVTWSNDLGDTIDNVTVADPGIEIDGGLFDTNIGISRLVDGEFIDISSETISVALLGGLLQNPSLEFTGLQWGVPGVIAGVTVNSSSGNFNSNNVTFTPNSVLIAGLDQIQQLGPLEQIDVTLNVQHSAVPVPAAVWLFGSGLVGLLGISRRHHR